MSKKSKKEKKKRKAEKKQKRQHKDGRKRAAESLTGVPGHETETCTSNLISKIDIDKHRPGEEITSGVEAEAFTRESGSRPVLVTSTTRGVKIIADDHDAGSWPLRKMMLTAHVAIPPSMLGKARWEVMRNIRTSLLLKYNGGIGGVLLAHGDLLYENGKSGVVLGRIRNELPHVHISVTFDGLAFCPRVDKPLLGVVIGSFETRLDLKVLRTFTTVVPASELREAGYDFDYKTFSWVHGASGDVITEGIMLRFNVAKIQTRSSDIRFEGSSPLEVIR